MNPQQMQVNNEPSIPTTPLIEQPLAGFDLIMDYLGNLDPA